jgi:8-oxo-dGTP diphosphatase
LANLAYKLGVSGVLTNGAGSVLLVRTAHAGWELPGGGVEPGEDLVAALLREVREEAGCTAAPTRLVAVHLHVARSAIHIIFSGTGAGRPATRGDEDSLEAGWFSVEDALRLVTHVTERDCLVHGLHPEAAPAYCAFT